MLLHYSPGDGGIQDHPWNEHLFCRPYSIFKNAWTKICINHPLRPSFFAIEFFYLLSDAFDIGESSFFGVGTDTEFTVGESKKNEMWKT